MANVSIEVFDGQEWKPITSEGKGEEIQVGSGKPAESLKAKIYFDIASSNIKSSEKIYFNV